MDSITKIVLSFVFLAVGCASKPPVVASNGARATAGSDEPPTPSPVRTSKWSDYSPKYTAFRDAMCRCKAGDSACAQKVSDEITAWATQMAKTARAEAAKMSPKEAEAMLKKITPIMTDYTRCMTAAMTPTNQPPDPYAP